MTRELTTPDVQEPIVYQAITNIEFIIPTSVVEGPPISVVMDKSSISVIYTVTDFSADGSMIRRRMGVANIPDWPVPFKDDVRSIYTRLENYAELQGIMGVGTSEIL